MKKMESRYAGKCSACGVRFPAGTLIEYDRTGARGRKAAHIDCASPSGTLPVALEEGSPGHGPGCFGECDGEYDCTLIASANHYATPREAARGVSYEVRTSGGTFYRNRSGRCEDAPCCGCCTF